MIKYEIDEEGLDLLAEIYSDTTIKEVIEMQFADIFLLADLKEHHCHYHPTFYLHLRKSVHLMMMTRMYFLE